MWPLPDEQESFVDDASTVPDDDRQPSPPSELLQVIENLAEFHRQHEQFYSQAPLRDAVALEAHSRVLKALVRHWQSVEARSAPLASPFAGAEDLNPPGLTAEHGVLFMEGEGEPAEMLRIKREVEALAAAVEETGDWLAKAMGQAWQAVGALVDYPSLAAVLGERHQIVVNDSLAAAMQTTVARLLHRALDLLARVDFAPVALREDISGPRQAPGYLFSASELIDRAADLLTDSARLVHENERRWRAFSARVDEINQ